MSTIEAYTSPGKKMWYYVLDGMTHEREYISDDECWAFLESLAIEHILKPKPNYMKITREVSG